MEKNIKDELCGIVNMTLGELPMRYMGIELPVRYMGIPLISIKLCFKDCQPIFAKIQQKRC